MRWFGTSWPSRSSPVPAVLKASVKRDAPFSTCASRITLFSLPGGGDLDVAAHSPRVVRIRIPLAMPMPAAALQLTAIQEANIMMMTSFPGSGILALADRVAWFGVIPTAIDQVEVRGGILATAESVHSRDAATDLARSILEINEEDRIGLEAVQRGVTSRYAERGRLSPKEAPGVLAFYRNLADALSGPQTGGR